MSGDFTMKKIALITDGWQRYVTAAWIIGYRRYLEDSHLDASLYVFHSFGFVIADDPSQSLDYYINLADEEMYNIKKAKHAAR